MISIVIPVLNEEQNLAPLHAEIDDVLRNSGLQAEMIIVDDGSKDGSWNVVRQLARRDPRVQGIRFRRNFGKASALSAGFASVRGEFVVTLDADLQDNPSEIPALIRLLEAGFDLVNGWKRHRFDPWDRVTASRIFNWMVRLASGLNLHDHNCGLKAYRVEVVREIRIYGELHRFITLLAHARGFKVTEVEVQHRPRLHGRSKYGIERFAKGLLDLLTVRVLTMFGDRPLHFLGAAGLIAFAAGFLGLAYLAWLWLTGHRPIGTRPVLIYSAASLLLGAQMMSVGILAELIVSRLSGESREVGRSYSVAEKIGSIGETDELGIRA